MSQTATQAALTTGTWNVDPSHSSVEFNVKHMGLATVKGFFSEFGGEIQVGEDGRVHASGTVEAASLNTRDAKRDEHLRSADFLEVEAHPQLRFESKSVEATGDDEYRIVGDLTIRGVTKEVELEAEVQGSDTDPWGNTRVGLEVRGQVERTEFGLTWNQTLESGGLLVGKKVKLVLDLSLVKA